MRIALLSYSTKPRGGVVHTLALAEALARAGQDVTVWTLGRDGDTGFFRPVDPRVRLEIVPFPDAGPVSRPGSGPGSGPGAGPGEGVGPRILRSIATLRAAFTPERYDIAHAQDCISANAVDHCIRTVHHLDTFSTPELAACHERAIVMPYAHVCVSASVAAEVAQGWGITATVIPNGVDASRFAAAAAASTAAGSGAAGSGAAGGGDSGASGASGASGEAAGAARQGWRDRLGRYVLAVGGIEPRKGSLDLLPAYALLRRSEPGLRLVIAGGETLFDYRSYRASWDALALELGVAPVVLGPVAHDELPSLVAAADVFCFPSVKEGFGLAAMEALAAGVPVVTRDLPVLREVFRDAVRYGSDPAGFAAAMRAALDAPGSLRSAGQALAAGYSWDAAAQAHLRLYAAQESTAGLDMPATQKRVCYRSRRRKSALDSLGRGAAEAAGAGRGRG